MAGAKSQEEHFAEVMTDHGITFVKPPHTDPGARLDYYLPDYDLYVELKYYNCERLSDQLNSVEGKCVMVLIGVRAVHAFAEMLRDVKRTDPY